MNLFLFINSLQSFKLQYTIIMKRKHAFVLVTKLLKQQMNRERRVISSESQPSNDEQEEMLINTSVTHIDWMTNIIAEAFMKMTPDVFNKFSGRSVDYVIYTYNEDKLECHGNAYVDGSITDQIVLDENHNINLRSFSKKDIY